MDTNFVRLDRAINKYIVDNDLKKNAYAILSLYEKREVCFEETVKLLEDIHPNIHFGLLSDAGQFPLATTGVFCKCNKNENNVFIVDPNPVAGGGNMIRSEQWYQCSANRLPGDNNYYYTPTGQSDDCVYVAPEDISLTCVRMLSGNLISCGD